MVGTLRFAHPTMPTASLPVVARSSLATGAAMRSGVYPNLASRFDFWPVSTEGHDAVIGLAFDPDERPPKPDALVSIIVRLLAMMLDRQHARSKT
jgi:hypothetical protein